MSGHTRLKQPDQIGVHEIIVIWNIKADHALAFEMFLKLRGKLIAMRFFHYKNDIRPLDLLR